MPMFAQGLAGVSRRLYDGGIQYHHAKEIAAATNPFMSSSAWMLFASRCRSSSTSSGASAFGEKAEANFWHATTLEWAATTSPPLGHGNFAVLPVVQRGPYEYSTPEYTETDYLPQHHSARRRTSGANAHAAAVAQREA